VFAVPAEVQVSVISHWWYHVDDMCDETYLLYSEAG
jgi:hypothetical protein